MNTSSIWKSKKEDHRKLGKELELFTFSKRVGQGLPCGPKGAELRERLEQFLKLAQRKAGYKPVISPHIGSKELTTSGHYAKYGADSFQPIQTPEDGRISAQADELSAPLRTLQEQTALIQNLPVRFAEFGTVYRYDRAVNSTV